MERVSSIEGAMVINAITTLGGSADAGRGGASTREGEVQENCSLLEGRETAVDGQVDI